MKIPSLLPSILIAFQITHTLSAPISTNAGSDLVERQTVNQGSDGNAGNGENGGDGTAGNRGDDGANGEDGQTDVQTVGNGVGMASIGKGVKKIGTHASNGVGNIGSNNGVNNGLSSNEGSFTGRKSGTAAGGNDNTTASNNAISSNINGNGNGYGDGTIGDGHGNGNGNGPIGHSRLATAGNTGTSTGRNSAALGGGKFSAPTRPNYSGTGSHSSSNQAGSHSSSNQPGANGVGVNGGSGGEAGSGNVVSVNGEVIPGGGELPQLGSDNEGDVWVHTRSR